MTVPAVKIKKMAESVKRRECETRAAVAVRVESAMAEVDRLVGEFRALDPAIEKIVLFGSLARKDATSIGFDIDLAVSCSKERYLALVARALDSPFMVDVVDLAVADDRIKSSIARDGVVLYEK
ncbi:MAG: nucleotidyltransferase domain-containing protein [Deltaproteobacteria bacterium]|nr:nucleotidyltransferase domain-containing protein [Deltaproteobacteria bacterium]